jgi:hypothetical protein
MFKEEDPVIPFVALGYGNSQVGIPDVVYFANTYEDFVELISTHPQADYAWFGGEQTAPIRTFTYEGPCIQ